MRVGVILVLYVCCVWMDGRLTTETSRVTSERSEPELSTSPPPSELTQPRLDALGCLWDRSRQLVESDIALRELVYDPIRSLTHLVSMLSALDHIRITKFEQDLYPDKTFLLAKDLESALIFGDVTQTAGLKEEFRTFLGIGQRLLHQFERIRVMTGTDDTFEYCQVNSIELQGSKCELVLKGMSNTSSVSLPPEANLQPKEMRVEILAEGPTLSLSWVNMAEPDIGIEYVLVARDIFEKLDKLKMIILQQLNEMLARLKMFDPLLGKTASNQCDRWLWYAFTNENPIIKTKVGQQWSEEYKQRATQCWTLEQRISDFNKEKRGLFNLLFEDNGQAIHQLARAQHDNRAAINILNSNQRSVVSKIKNLEVNLKSLRETAWLNFEDIQSKLQIIQARHSFENLRQGRNSMNLRYQEYIDSIYSQTVISRTEWDDLFGDLVAELDITEKCNLHSKMSRIACKRGKGYLKSVEKGRFKVISNSVMMVLKNVWVPSCMIKFSGEGEKHLFKGNGLGFLKQEDTLIHENLTVPTLCQNARGKVEKLSCTEYLVPLEQVQHKTPVKGGVIYYLHVADKDPGVFLQAEDPINIITSHNSTTLHQKPQFFNQHMFPVYIGKSEYHYDEFVPEHDSVGERFYLEHHFPGYFRFLSSELSQTPAEIISSVWRERIFKQIKQSFLKQDPVFISVSSTAGVLMLGFIVSGICCCYKKCCKDRDGQSHYFKTYKTRARKAWRRNKKEDRDKNRENQTSQDPEVSLPFLHSSAPTLGTIYPGHEMRSLSDIVELRETSEHGSVGGLSALEAGPRGAGPPVPGRSLVSVGEMNRDQLGTRLTPEQRRIWEINASSTQL